MRSGVAVVLLALWTLVLYGQALREPRLVAGDSFHHLINGIFVHDCICSPAASLSDPLGFAMDYYRHFPSVNLGYYPPLFPFCEAVVMMVVGVSSFAGQLTVLCFAVLLAMFAYAWFRLRFEPGWALGAAAILVTTPTLVYWGRDVMLEIPTLALMLGGMWGFESAIRSDRPSWKSCLVCGVCTALALLTKQHALMLLGIFLISIVACGRWKHLVNPRVGVALGLIGIAAAAIIIMTLEVGGAAVGQTVGLTKQHVAQRFHADLWLFYLRSMPEILTWPTIVLAVVGLVVSLWRRIAYVSSLIAWIVVFYVMHSYFRGQTARYGCLWIPPFVCLGAMGLRFLLDANSSSGIAEERSRRPIVGGVVMAMWFGVLTVQTLRMPIPTAPGAYQVAADHLADVAPPFSCLTFFPDFPGRPSTCYRLAIERFVDADRPVTSFGHIVRAGQVLRDWSQSWNNLDELDESLREWNVKYVMTELPRPINPRAGEDVVADAVDGVVGDGRFHEVARWPVDWVDKHVPQRTLILYERTEPMVFNENASWPMKLARMKITIDSQQDTGTP